MGSTCRSARQTPAGIDRLYTANDENGLEDLLGESDYVVLALPLTNASRGLMNVRTLAVMKRSAKLVNIARGAMIDEMALTNALQKNGSAGAGPDVFCQEPRPSDRSLWTLPNVLITPHTSAQAPDRDDRAVASICDNINRYRAGQPLHNEVTDDDLYTP